MEIDEIFRREDSNKNQIYLYQQGSFFRAYNQSAMRFEKLFRKYKILSKFIKKLERPVYYLGFPKQNLDPIHEVCKSHGYFLLTNKDSVQIEIPDQFEEDFEKWCNENSLRLIHSLNPKIDDLKRNELLKKIFDFPLLQKTPFEAFEFLYRIKTKLELLEF